MKNSLFWSIIKTYRFKSLFWKDFLLILCVVIFPLLLAVSVLLYSYFASERAKTEESYIVNNNTVAAETDTILDMTTSAYSSFCINSNVLSYLNTEKFSSVAVLSENVNQINNIFDYIISSSPYYDSIYLYKKSTKYILSKKLSNYDYLFPDMSWRELYAANNEHPYISFRKADIYGAKYDYITVCNNIYSGTEVRGVIVFNLKTDMLKNLIPDYSNISEFTIADDTGKIIFSNNEAKVGSTAVYANENQVTESKGNFFSVTVQSPKNRYFITTSYKLVSAVSNNKLYITIAVIALFLVIAAAVIVAYWVSGRFYKGILTVIEILQSDSTDKSDFADEYQYISKNILNMKSSLSNYEVELSSGFAQLKKTQIKSLQNQINPHFIFNTLNLISTIDMSKNKGETDISRIVRLLSFILRGVIDTTSNITSFADEIEYLDAYMELENIRYDNQFEYVKNINDDTLSLSCVKFMLQPIIENSITHGILRSETGRGKITVSSNADDKLFTVTVTNTGASIPHNKLAELKSNLANNILPESKHIGLLNVNSRIKLIFGDIYGCNISSDENGTTVTVTLPSRKFE